jgi:predicted MPP superfamily phosphohydrolase
MYEPSGKTISGRPPQTVKPQPAILEFADLHLRGKTVKRLRFFSTMDNESYDDILNRLMDVVDNRRRRSIFEDKQWMRENNQEYLSLLPPRSRSKHL